MRRMQRRALDVAGGRQKRARMRAALSLSIGRDSIGVTRTCARPLTREGFEKVVLFSTGALGTIWPLQQQSSVLFVGALPHGWCSPCGLRGFFSQQPCAAV